MRIDGGMSANDWMAQDLADILEIEVERPDFIETTALGAAILAAVGCGLHADLETAALTMRSETTTFSPKMDGDVRTSRLARYSKALSAA